MIQIAHRSPNRTRVVIFNSGTVPVVVFDETGERYTLNPGRPGLNLVRDPNSSGYFVESARDLEHITAIEASVIS